MINLNEIKSNFIGLIDKEWILISAGDKEKFSTMTVSQGGVGALWNRPVVFVSVRLERCTHESIDARNKLTIIFLGPEYRKAHSICGSKSGWEIDKMTVTGLMSLFTGTGNPVFEEAHLMPECKAVYKSEIEGAKLLDLIIFPRRYDEKNDSTHTVYIVKTLNAWEK